MRKLSTIPQGNFGFDLNQSISKAADTYGYLRLTLVDENGRKFSAVGVGYSLEEMVIKDWLNHITRSADGQERLKEIYESGERKLGANVVIKHDTVYLVKAGKGLEHMQYLMEALGMEYEPLYSSERKNAYKTGYYIENKGFGEVIA